jgi:hypothetical protein
VLNAFCEIHASEPTCQNLENTIKTMQTRNRKTTIRKKKRKEEELFSF